MMRYLPMYRNFVATLSKVSLFKTILYLSRKEIIFYQDMGKNINICSYKNVPISYGDLPILGAILVCRVTNSN